MHSKFFETIINFVVVENVFVDNIYTRSEYSCLPRVFSGNRIHTGSLF